MDKLEPNILALTQQELKRLLTYDRTTGVFAWREDVNTSAKGKPIGSKNGNVYLTARIRYKKYYLHRPAWLYEYGEWPSGVIDHANNDRSDNRIENLRDATGQQNSANAALRSDNEAGLRGVCRHSQCDRWRAHIVIDGKQRSLGLFLTREAAANAYDAAAIAAFGEFAKLNGGVPCRRS